MDIAQEFPDFEKVNQLWSGLMRAPPKHMCTKATKRSSCMLETTGQKHAPGHLKKTRVIRVVVDIMEGKSMFSGSIYVKPQNV